MKNINPRLTLTRTAWVRSVLITSVAALLLVFPCVVRGELIDRIVAAVNYDVITWSDLEQAVRFNAALSGGSPDMVRLRTETLEGLINRSLFIQEARRLRFVEVSAQDVSAEIEKLRKRFGSDKEFSDFLAGLGITKEQLDHMLTERLLVERFVEKKIGLFVRVSRDEAQSYYDSHPSEFPGKRFLDVQRQVMALLYDEKLGRQEDEYLAELRSKAEVRMNP
ncbi:MAG TPA: SurA N-terminal domain-containing protein [Bacteroidota bacterium]|nr:SurA N-terminal domain-containing protein [Bacteroidota bacterium]HXY55068.1 SurA N-terminal domain-containing protein [Nitrospirota bacterium]